MARDTSELERGVFAVPGIGGAYPRKKPAGWGRYPWLRGYSLAFILVASYDHHQEHIEKLLAWLGEHGNMKTAE